MTEAKIIHFYSINRIKLLILRHHKIKDLMLTDCAHILDGYNTISLDDMSSIRLMNRIDSKYLANEDQLLRLLELAKDDYMVQEINGVRQSEYRTQYLDDRFNTMYLNHHNGRLTRQKVRIRTYVDTSDYFFEVKLKNNHGRTKKKRVDMVDFDPLHPDHGIRFRCQNRQYVAYEDFLRKHLRYDPAILSEHLENHFHRITLVNKAKTERLTIDTDLRFHNLVTHRDMDLTGLAIIELKRDGLQPSPILGLLRELRIKPSGFSKYCMGSALTDPSLKRNNFKERLRLVKRLLSRMPSS